MDPKYLCTCIASFQHLIREYIIKNVKFNVLLITLTYICNKMLFHYFQDGTDV